MPPSFHAHVKILENGMSFNRDDVCEVQLYSIALYPRFFFTLMIRRTWISTTHTPMPPYAKSQEQDVGPALNLTSDEGNKKTHTLKSVNTLERWRRRVEVKQKTLGWDEWVVAHVGSGFIHGYCERSVALECLSPLWFSHWRQRHSWCEIEHVSPESSLSLSLSQCMCDKCWDTCHNHCL